MRDRVPGPAAGEALGLGPPVAVQQAPSGPPCKGVDSGQPLGKGPEHVCPKRSSCSGAWLQLWQLWVVVWAAPLSGPPSFAVNACTANSDSRSVSWRVEVIHSSRAVFRQHPYTLSVSVRRNPLASEKEIHAGAVAATVSARGMGSIEGKVWGLCPVTSHCSEHCLETPHPTLAGGGTL